MKQFIFILILFSFLAKSQERNFGDSSNPVPSAASFSTLANTPVSLVTGVPNISIPLFSLPTNNKNISVPIELRYHIYNAGVDKPSTEVGLGWLLQKGGVISRGITVELDEKYDDATKPNYKLNKFDDTYFYNLPGISGKFHFVRDTINNTFTLNNLTENHLKIDYVRTSNTATLIPSSFKITDERGVQYVFDDYSLAIRDRHYNYRSAFYLTKILDENSIEVVNFTYQKNTKYSGDLVTYQNCILTKVSSNFGTVDFENVYESYWETNGNTDPYKIHSVSLSDKSGRLVTKYKFEYSSIDGDGVNQYPFDTSNNRRTLYYLHKLDKDQHNVGLYQFTYNQTLYPAPTQPPCLENPLYPYRNYLYGSLSEISFPEGGRTNYFYENNTVFSDYTVTGHEYEDADNYTIKYPNIQRYVSSNIVFDTNQTKTYTFQVDAPRSVYLGFDVEEYYKDQYHLTIHDDPDTYVYKMSYKLKKDGVVINGTTCDAFNTQKYDLVSGTYTIELTGFGYGSVSKMIIQTDPPPYVFHKAYGVTQGARIKEIRYSDNYIIKKRMTYEYNFFDDALSSSGTNIYDNKNNDYSNSTILYRNVKEIYGDSNSNLGYSKYYFKAPLDFTTGNGHDLTLYYFYHNILSEGLISKKETYNTQNQMISSDSMTYVLEEISGTPVYTVDFGKSKMAWLKSQKTISKTFFSNGTSLENISETSYSPSNYEAMYTKQTSHDGNITEQTIKYPTDVPNSRLLAANILSVPLETEIKINGSLISKAETKYDNASTFFPTSVTSYEMQNQNAQTKVIFTAYDSYGNLIESKTPQGIPTTTIYGYNHTRPIAKIEGASYSDIGSLSVVQNAVTASNTATPENDSTLKTTLESLRVSSDLKDYIVTTYTWDVLTGMTGTTSANGSKERYEYDRAGRLWKVWDKDGKLLKEYQYNYKY